MKNKLSTILYLEGIFEISLEMGEKYISMNLLPKKYFLKVFSIEECKIATDKYLLEVHYIFKKMV